MTTIPTHVVDSVLAEIRAEGDRLRAVEAAAHSVLAQDGRRLRVLPGGGGVTGQVRPGKHAASAIPAQQFTLAADKTRTLLAALAASGSTAMHVIADDLSGQVHPSLLPAADWCPPTGMERPS